MTPMTDPSTSEIPKTVWPCLVYDDARAAIAFLTETFGMELRCSYPPEGDVVAHAELRWPEGGGVMLGSSGRDDSPFAAKPTGAATVYVVTDDPAAINDAAIAAGATIIRPLAETDYGSLDVTVADPEGNLWSFGTYRGE